MKARTYLSTDWIEVHDGKSAYMVRVFLTDEDKAYMITRQNDKKRFFRVDARLIKTGELGFFEKVMKSAKELPITNSSFIMLSK